MPQVRDEVNWHGEKITWLESWASADSPCASSAL
jgi:HD domain-containing protein